MSTTISWIGFFHGCHGMYIAACAVTSLSPSFLSSIRTQQHICLHHCSRVSSSARLRGSYGSTSGRCSSSHPWTMSQALLQIRISTVRKRTFRVQSLTESRLSGNLHQLLDRNGWDFIKSLESYNGVAKVHGPLGVSRSHQDSKTLHNVSPFAAPDSLCLRPSCVA